MNPAYESLYNEMLKDIGRAMQLQLPESERVSKCFWIAINYWERLKNLTNPERFKCDQEEIDFFKEVKPKFTSQIAFFTILSEALVCVPQVAIDAFNYWEEEANRIKRFCDRHSDFVGYYEGSDRSKDFQYFLRRNSRIGYIPKAPVYDVDPEYCTAQDHLVRQYLANKIYVEYCKRRIEEIASLRSQ